MVYREIAPPQILTDFVKLIWIQEHDATDDYVPPERIVADGIVELVFHFGNPFVTYFSDGTVEKQPTSFAIAQSSKHILIQPAGKIGIIAVRFHPWGAYHFFDLQIREFSDRIIPIDHLWRAKAAEIEDRICAAQDNRERLHIIIRFLLEQLAENHKPRYATDRVIQFIHRSRGQLSIKELTEKTGIGERTLERSLRSTLGISPKHFSRITRFLNTCHFIRHHKDKNLTQITYECGYYDQAHLIREFKAFAGITPKEFFASANTSFSEFE